MKRRGKRLQMTRRCLEHNMIKQIVLEDGKLPFFTGQWTIGEVVNMAQQLERWVLSLQIQPTPQAQTPIEQKMAELATDVSM